MGSTTKPIVATGLAVGINGRSVLSGINLDIGSGVTAIIGRNGAGKSTLLRTLATILPPQAGQCFLNGRDVTRRHQIAEIRQEIGYLPQQPDFPGNFTVREMLRYVAGLRAVRDAKRAVSAIEGDLALSDFSDRRLAKLSGGERQRAFLGMSLIHNPAVLLLDEPTQGLDLPARRDLLTLLNRVATQRCVVFTTHLVDDLMGGNPTVIVVANNQVTSQGTVASLAQSESGHAGLADRLAAFMAEP